MERQLVYLVVLVFALSGCSVIQSLQRITVERYQRQCDQFGFVRGTDAYGQCMLQQQALDQASEEHDRLIHAMHDH